ncbi:hypothetical protein [Mycoplasma todarodis]|uniref:hypothetical protein n=1 Tax=Mycoplasma todarodis TaxID=1937191 RepID=UPI003B384B23
MKNKQAPATRSNQDKEYIRNLKVANASFKSQFSIGKLLVAAVLVVIILLGPIIMVTTNNIEEKQMRQGSILLAKIPTSAIKDQKLHDLLTTGVFNDTKIDALIAYLNDPRHKVIAGIAQNYGLTEATLERMTISSLSFSALAQIFSTAILYALGWGIFSALKDKNMMDRNRVMYMNFSKHSILFWKVFSETIMFLFIVVVADGMGMLLVSTAGKGQISSDLFKQLGVQLIAMTVFYFFIQIGIRLISSRIQSKTIKGVVLAGWLLSTAFLYIVLSIVFGVKPETTDVIINNKYVFAFIPIINIVVLPLVLYGSLPLWTIVPFVVYALIAVALVWKKLTASVKDYLCS